MTREGYKKNGKYYVYCRDHYEEVNEAVYRTIMEEVWREEKRQQRAWRCRDGQGIRCNGNCRNCERYLLGEGPIGSDVSLDQLSEEYDYEPEGSAGFENEVVLKITLDTLVEELSKTIPDAARIVDMIKYEELEKDVAAELGIAKTTLNYRKNKVIAFLREHLKDYR